MRPRRSSACTGRATGTQPAPKEQIHAPSTRIAPFRKAPDAPKPHPRRRIAHPRRILACPPGQIKVLTLIANGMLPASPHGMMARLDDTEKGHAPFVAMPIFDCCTVSAFVIAFCQYSPSALSPEPCSSCESPCACDHEFHLSSSLSHLQLRLCTISQARNASSRVRYGPRRTFAGDCGPSSGLPVFVLKNHWCAMSFICPRFLELQCGRRMRHPPIHGVY